MVRDEEEREEEKKKKKLECKSRPPSAFLLSIVGFEANSTVRIEGSLTTTLLALLNSEIFLLY